MTIPSLPWSMLAALSCALVVAAGGCSDDGIAPVAESSGSGPGSSGEYATSSVNTSATVTASDTADGPKLDVPADPGTTGGDSEGLDSGTAGLDTGEAGTDETGTSPEPPCVAGEECSCDPGPEACGLPSPDCPTDHAPLFDERSQCWDGSCVPTSSCHTVPECAYCDEDEACVVAVDLGGSHRTCQPIDPGCVDLVPTCDCMPMACDEPFFQCTPQRPGAEADLGCVCPTC